MELREYRSADCAALAELFYHTVHTVNARDYSPRQLAVWATGQVDLAAWDASLLRHTTLVAERDGTIVGFADMDDAGYLDRLYVHRDHQSSGVATALLGALEQRSVARGVYTFTTHASITARPFFQGAGYRVVAEHQVVRRGVMLLNYLMEKHADPPVHRTCIQRR